MIPDLNLRDGIHIPAETVEGFLWGGIESGVRWIQKLPALLESICQQHNLTDLRTSPELRMNLVLFGESAIHGPVVIKISPPNWEVSNEIASMRIYSRGNRYAKFLDADDSAAWIMLERILPGEMLQTLAQSSEVDDEEATRITARLMQETIQPVPDNIAHTFPDLNTWLKSLWEYADSGRREIPAEQVELAVRHARELIAHPEPPMLLHGDFHHGNILQGKHDWVMIDPKGILAEKAFEVGPFFYNPIGIDQHPHLVDLFDRRLSIFSQELGISRVRLWKNALVACVLSDCWTLDDGRPVDHAHFDTVTAALMHLPERFA